MVQFKVRLYVLQISAALFALFFQFCSFFLYFVSPKLK